MAETVFKQAADEVIDRIKGLSISGISSGQVRFRKLPWDDNIIHTGITVSPEQEVSNRPGEASNERDEIGYKFLVTYVRGTSRGWESGFESMAQFRQKVRREFNNKRLTTVSASCVNHVICRVVHSDVILPKKHVNNYDVSQLAVICWFLEPRT